MGTIVQVHFKPHARLSERFTYQFIETDMVDLDQVLQAIDSDQLIRGTVLFSHPGNEHHQRIVHREEVVGFRGSAVDRVGLPVWRFERQA